MPENILESIGYPTIMHEPFTFNSSASISQLDPINSNEGSNNMYNLTAYPNPFDGNNTNISYSLEQNGVGYLKIYDTFGRLVKDYKLDNNRRTQIVSDLETGMYYVSLHINNENVSSIKLIKK